VKNEKNHIGGLLLIAYVGLLNIKRFRAFPLCSLLEHDAAE
jgi:hypothetical protein